MFSKRIERISESATLAMTAKAAELRESGKKVINLSVGEPDFPTPDNIRQAGKLAIDNGHTRYTPGGGTLNLKKAAALKMARDNNLHYKPEEILISCGGKHALYNACQVLFQTTDEVIIFSPYWVSFPDFISITGAKPIFVTTDPDNQFAPDFNDLKNKISNKTKGIIINSPSNPTGGVWSDETIFKVLNIAKEINAWVFSDECYEQLTYDAPFKSIASLDKTNNKILTFQSCSKTYAMTGWRIGYTAGNKDVIKAMGKLQGQSTSCPNSIAQAAAIEALTGDQKQVSIMKKIFKKRRDYIISRFNNMQDVDCTIPGGAFYVFPNFNVHINNSTLLSTANDLAMYLLEKKALISVSGDAFGAPGYIRFSYAAGDEDLKNGMDLLEDALNEI